MLEDDRQKKIVSDTPGGLTTTLLTLLWSVPLSRAVAFYRATHAVFTETNSSNDYNDFAYSIFLLTAYGICLLSAWGFARIVFCHPRVVLWLPFCGHLIAVLGTIRLQPERVIVLIPDLTFPWPVAISVGATGLAAILHFGLNKFSKPGKTQISNS